MAGQNSVKIFPGLPYRIQPCTVATVIQITKPAIIIIYWSTYLQSSCSKIQEPASPCLAFATEKKAQLTVYIWLLLSRLLPEHHS